jgi:predicted DNA-binding transcriptional regulator AlpA
MTVDKFKQAQECPAHPFGSLSPSNPIKNDCLLNVKETAHALGCSVATVWRKAADGTLPKPVKIGGMTRWSQLELGACIEKAKAIRAAA